MGAITSIVEQNQSEVVRNNATKEFTRKYKFSVSNDLQKLQQDKIKLAQKLNILIVVDNIMRI